MDVCWRNDTIENRKTTTSAMESQGQQNWVLFVTEWIFRELKKLHYQQAIIQARVNEIKLQFSQLVTIDWNIMTRKKKLPAVINIKFKRKTRDMSEPRQVRFACLRLALYQTQVMPSHYLPFSIALLILFCVTVVSQLFTQVMPLVQATNSGASVNNINQSVVGMRSGRVADFSLAGELRQQVALPCLVGRASLCGLPYLIVWYKFSLASNSWVRLESSGRTNTGSSSRICKATSLQRQDECVQFDISSVQLTDEGDYKCQVTYAEDSLDSDSNKCPASTITQLFVVGKFWLLLILQDFSPSHTFFVRWCLILWSMVISQFVCWVKRIEICSPSKAHIQSAQPIMTASNLCNWGRQFTNRKLAHYDQNTAIQVYKCSVP